ncbi:MAG: hypothetical protein H7288_16535 [Kineosporiaceae bacterium]|nr:hypothetical protein [Aeromicrobium sp.]
MTERNQDEWFLARHRTPVIAILVLLTLYAVSSTVHYLRSYDYTDDAVSAYRSAQSKGLAVGLLSQSQSEGLIDNGKAIRSSIERLEKPGNAAFTPVFDRLMAEVKSAPKYVGSASTGGACFLFPVIPVEGESIDKIVGFTRFCFKDPNDKQTYSAVSVAISNR